MQGAENVRARRIDFGAGTAKNFQHEPLRGETPSSAALGSGPLLGELGIGDVDGLRRAIRAESHPARAVEFIGDNSRNDLHTQTGILERDRGRFGDRHTNVAPTGRIRIRRKHGEFKAAHGSLSGVVLVQTVVGRRPNYAGDAMYKGPTAPYIRNQRENRMAERQKLVGLFQDQKGNWLYRRAVPKELQTVMDQKLWIRSLGSHDREVAKERWVAVNREYESAIFGARYRLQGQERRLALAGPNSKDARRHLMWDAISRWLHHKARVYDGRLPLPEYVAIPTKSAMTSHAFMMIRGEFTQWARLHMPDAIEVLDLGDTKEGNLFFHHGLIAAYFVVRSMLELGPVLSER